jgi:hypothetical protein
VAPAKVPVTRSPFAAVLVNSPVNEELLASIGTVQVVWLSVKRPVWVSRLTPSKTDWNPGHDSGGSVKMPVPS